MTYLTGCFQLQYFTLWIIERYVPSDTPQYEKCRLIVSNSTLQQLRHRLACFLSEIFILNKHKTPLYDSYISNGLFLWSLTGKSYFFFQEIDYF